MNYEVLKGDVGGFNNKSFKKGDIVTELNFPTGNAEKLVELGFLKIADEKEESTMTKKEIVQALKDLEADFNPADSKGDLLDLLNSLSGPDSGDDSEDDSEGVI
jgi:hypothetical protein